MKEVGNTGKKEKKELINDAVKLIRELADVLEELLITKRDNHSDKKNEEKELKSKEVTFEDVRVVLLKLSRHGKTANVNELIVKFGRTKLSDVPKENYGQLLKEAEEIKN